MTTKSIVPRANGEGGLGTTAKHWGSAYIDDVHTTCTFPMELHAGEAIVYPESEPGIYNTATLPNGLSFLYVEFPFDDDHRATWTKSLPETWTAAAIPAKVNAINLSALAGDVVWEIYGGRCADGEDLDMVLVSLGTVTVTFDGTTKRQLSAALNLTIPGNGNYAGFQLRRKYGDAGDTLDASVGGLGINLEIPCTLNP